MATRRPGKRMDARGAVLALALGVGMMMGCETESDHVDVTPPAVPTGVASVTGDREVILSWIPNREPDLAGYHILVNEDGGPAFTIIATVDADDPYYYDPGAGLGDDLMVYTDQGEWTTGLRNGREYWYAVLAFDYAGNESDLSYELVRDVPRPQGQVILEDRFTGPAFAGFDFSAQSGDPLPWDDPRTDVFVEYDDWGVPFLIAANSLVRIQDYGNVGFDVATFAPRDGWSRTGFAELVEGHTYIVEIATGSGANASVNYAKLWVFDLSGSAVDFDWGYQVRLDERQLKMPAPRGTDEPTTVKEQLP